MEIDKIFSFLTYPGKNAEEQPEIGGVEIPKKGKIFKMLNDIFKNSEVDCKIPIIFTSENDDQKNDVKDEILALMESGSIDDGLILANRLQSVTTKTSGMGLLFFTIGYNDKNSKMIISRFPADEGIVAEKKSEALKVEFVEQVFLKNAYSYKSVLYQCNIESPNLWKGLAVDKQALPGGKEIAGYWISSFLKSDFQTTPRQGTKRLALALRDAIKKSNDPSIKHEITSSVKLATNITNKAMAISEFCKLFHLSPEATKAVSQNVNPTRLLEDKFVFDKEEFQKYLPYKMIELSNGAILTAESAEFDNCFKSEKRNNSPEIKFTTVGSIVDEKFKRTK
ncbi:hypothetical protein [Desulfospira joergensenii]|uniref:hypothetical protein n=1 Tax=Desulfospira joergensenii TaxID=53329 RepID=UPI0003B45464|nr:hypothetical protein [Desulfospira joergensenii]